MLQQPDARQNTFHKRWGGFPERRNRSIRSAVLAGMENSLVPPPRSLRVFRIIANHVQQRPRGADADRFGILRHQQHMAPLLLPDLAHKFAKSFGIRQIQSAARRAPMPVSARD